LWPETRTGKGLIDLFGEGAEDVKRMGVENVAGMSSLAATGASTPQPPLTCRMFKGTDSASFGPTGDNFEERRYTKTTGRIH